MTLCTTSDSVTISDDVRLQHTKRHLQQITPNPKTLFLNSQKLGPGVPLSIRATYEPPRPPSPPEVPKKDPEYEYFKSVFTSVDEDGDGTLDKDEVRSPLLLLASGVGG